MKLYQRFLPYAIALISTAIALVLTICLEPFLLRTIGAFFYIAIIVTAWYGGWRPGGIAVVLSSLAIDYLFIEPRNQFRFEQLEDILQLAFFVLVGLIINLLTSNFRDSKQKIERLGQKLAQENSDLLRIAPSAAQMGMWNWDMATGQIQWSTDHELLFGLTPGTFDGSYETFQSFLHPDDKQLLNDAIQQAVQNKSLYQLEFRAILRDGSLHWMEARGHAFYDEAGQPLQVTGTVTAIDERKQAQGMLQQQFEQQRLVMEMIQGIRRSLKLEDILQTTVDQVRQFLNCDRVIIFQFSPTWSGTAVVESVGADWQAILGTEIYDPCFGDNYVEPYKQGLVTVKSDIYNAGIAPCHLQLLESFQVKANLVVPIIKRDNLWGLLIAHNCEQPRQWQSLEIDLLRQIASQVSIALQQSKLFEELQTELAERKLAEAALQEREAVLSLFAQYVPASIAMFDMDMRYIMASQQWLEIYKLPSVEALINRSHYEIFPEISERWRQIHQRCLAGAIEKCDEDLFVWADGTQQWFWWEIHPWHTATNEIGGIIIFSVDITQRKQAEIALLESEEKLRLFIRYAPASIVMFDRQMCYLAASQRWLDEFESNSVESIESIIGRSHYEQFPNLEERLKQSHQRGLAGLTEICDEDSFFYSDGSEQWFHWEVHPWYHNNGDIGGIVVFTENITERKLAEVALRQSEERYRMLFESIDEGFCVIEMLFNENGKPFDYRFLEINPAFEKQTGLEQAEGKTALELIPNLEENWFEILGKVAITGESLRFENGSPAMNRWFDLYVLRVGGSSSRKVAVVFKDITDRKQAERALVQLNAELEQRVAQRTTELSQVNDRLLETVMEQQHTQMILLEQAQLLDLAHDMIMTRDLNSVITFWNQGAEKMSGWSKAEALGQESQIFLQTQFPKSLVEIESELLKQGYWEGELIHTRKDGSTMTVASRWVMQKDQMGRPIKVLEINNDITLQKQAQATLQQYVSDIEDLYNNAPCGYQSLDADGNLLRVNETALNWLGYTRQEILDKKFVDLITPQGRQAFLESFPLFKTQSWIDNLEFEMVAKDGTTRWVSLNSTALKDEVGNFVMSRSTLFDISDRKRTEEALRQSEAQFRSLSECSPVGIFMTDVQGQCTYTNPRYQAICGCRFDEALGDGWMQFIHPEDLQEVNAGWLKAVCQGLEFRREIRYVHKEQIVRFGRVQSAPIFSVTGELSGYVGTVEDVTESRVVETMKKEFISIVSHELRTPLASIRGSLGFCLRCLKK